MSETPKMPDTTHIKLGEISQRQLGEPSGIYEDDGVTPLSNRTAIQLLEQAGAQVFPSANGWLSPEATAINRAVHRGEREREDYTVAIVAKRSSLPAISWRAEDHNLHR